MDYERFARLQARFTDEKLLTNEGVYLFAGSCGATYDANQSANLRKCSRVR